LPADDHDYFDAQHAVYEKCEAGARLKHNVASREQIIALITAYPLPALIGSSWYRDSRYIYWSIYRKLCTAVVLVNIAVITTMLYKDSASLTYQQASIGTGVNFLCAAFGRQEHCVNLLFHMACTLPRWIPLWTRKHAAQVYSHGGLHSGCGLSAFLWYIIFTVLLVRQFQGTKVEICSLGPITAVILSILMTVIVTSHPYIRKRWTKHWEISHRYGGWTAILLSWAQTVIMCVAQARQDHVSLGLALAQSPSFWILITISHCLIYPWLRLRRRRVEAEQLSNHAVRLWFDDKKISTCRGHRFSHFPLVENHGLTTIPNGQEEHGYSVVVSEAGDWSKDLIDNPPKHLWTHGAPTIGVLRIATLFRPIVVVATGSGIAPCLSLLQVCPSHPMRIIWSARSPATTYGIRIFDAVLRADRDAFIIDTDSTGRPDLLALSYALYREISAEAVVIVSNAKVTTQLVLKLEARRIAAFGPIF